MRLFLDGAICTTRCDMPSMACTDKLNQRHPTPVVPLWTARTRRSWHSSTRCGLLAPLMSSHRRRHPSPRDCCLGLDSVEGTSSLTLDRHRMHSRPACITRRPTDWLASVPRDHWKNMGRPRRNFQLRCGGPRLRHDDRKLRASERAR
jgi:hypothetical protein